MLVNKFRSSNHSGRVVASAVAMIFAASLVGCGGGDGTDAGIGSSMKMMAKSSASLSSSSIPVQPGQSVGNLNSNAGDGSGTLWYSVTLPVGANALKIATSGGTGTPLINVTTKTDPAASYTTCTSRDVCQFGFAALTQPTTYYINVGTRTSYANTTLVTYAAPANVIPLVSGQTVSGLTGAASDNPAMFSIVVPPGSSKFSAALTGGSGSATLNVIRGTTDKQFASTCGNPCTLANPNATTYYIYVSPGNPAATFENWTLSATVS